MASNMSRGAGAGIGRAIDRNAPARLAFWLAMVSIPLGPVFGIPALVAGAMGLRRQSRAPSEHGTRNAWIGIAVALLSTAVWTWIVVALLMGGGVTEDYPQE